MALRRRTGSGLAAANEKGRIAIRVQLDDGPRPLGGGSYAPAHRAAALSCLAVSDVSNVESSLTTNKGTIETGDSGPWFDRPQHGRTCSSEHLRLPALVGFKRVKQLGLIASLMEVFPPAEVGGHSICAATQPRSHEIWVATVSSTRRLYGSYPKVCWQPSAARRLC